MDHLSFILEGILWGGDMNKVLKNMLLLLGLLTFIAVYGCDNNSSAESEIQEQQIRPDNWAKAVDIKGVGNLYRVSTNLYRSEQPTTEGFKELENLGVKTIVNLRSFNSDRDNITGTNLAYEHIYMKAWHPEEKEVIRFLKIATDQNSFPVLVHCQHGADRTGTMVAIYRIAICGWSKSEALNEMKNGGYGFHTIWKGLPKFIEELDVDSITKEVGEKNLVNKELCNI